MLSLFIKFPPFLSILIPIATVYLASGLLLTSTALWIFESLSLFAKDTCQG